MNNRNVLISGAGIAGPTLAYWLLQHGFTPTLVEHAPALRTGGYMIDFWGVGWDVAERMELVPRLREVGYRLQGVQIVDAGGATVARLDAGAYEVATRGRFTSLLRGDLAEGIYARLEGKVETRFGDSVTALHQDSEGVEVEFAHAPAQRFDMVMGADGLHSAVRTAAMPQAAPHYLGYRTASFIAMDYPFRDDGCIYRAYSVPGRQAARYTLRDGRTAFLFVFVAPPREERPDETPQQTLRREYAGAGWECDRMLAAMPGNADLYLDDVSQMRLPGWSQGRVALVGDAAFCPSLLAGQGSACAMAGAYLLAAELARVNGDYAAAFAAYQARFKPFMDKLQSGVVRMGSWFAPKTAFGIKTRNLVTNLMNARVLSNWSTKVFLGRAFDLS